ncbi:gp101 [Rhodococcus phage ReqiPepy6]|uniref:Gp101 n=1 Tax=Rhodococcus phage ReqiPepy6 TaxID=691965 RepID=D4P7L2_9CAUD|nr:gp101 [Rhodococcus phage ReqiPepy6]ADD80992.1 gp101 [Rhodococcus phage ReqiPepy6]
MKGNPMHYDSKAAQYDAEVPTLDESTSPESYTRTRKCIEFTAFFLLSYAVALVVIYTLLKLFGV